jgi:SAM-dependent methyltransferase
MNQPPDFNRLAGLYKWMEVASFGPWLWWCRCAFLGDLGRCRRALILGDGDGRFTARLLRAYPGIRADAVDASSAMLRALARRAGAQSAEGKGVIPDETRRNKPQGLKPNLSSCCVCGTTEVVPCYKAGPKPSISAGWQSDRLRIHLADIRGWQPAGPPYDLVVTHFFLDCLTTDEVECVASRIRKAVSPGALWVVSEFDLPAGWFGRLVARRVVAMLYWAFGWLTGLQVRSLPDHRFALRRAGFTLSKRRAWLGGLLVSELWSASAADLPVNSTGIRL